jgi:hypothetical protein
MDLLMAFGQSFPSLVHGIVSFYQTAFDQIIRQLLVLNLLYEFKALA